MTDQHDGFWKFYKKFTIKRFTADFNHGIPKKYDHSYKLMQSANVEARCHAVWNLSEIDDPRAEEALITALKDKAAYVRCMAAMALGSKGATKALGPNSGNVKR